MTQHELQAVRESSRGVGRRGGLCTAWKEAEAQTAKMFSGDYKFARRQAAAPAAAAAACSSVCHPPSAHAPARQASICVNLNCHFEGVNWIQ